jgi:hypothetical protein
MVHGAGSKDDKKVANTARFAGAACAGALEIITFHPIDTIAKRLMSNEQKVFGDGKTFGQSMNIVHDVIFRKAKDQGVFKKYMSLFPGIGFGAAYKVLQRVYKFGGQPIANDLLYGHFKEDFVKVFGRDGAKPWIQATSGALIGIGEIVLLPLDVLKIKQQTNPEALRGRNVLKIFIDEGFGLYRGAMWTAARNAPGSFALFGGNAFAKEYIFKLDDYNKATFFQNGISSIIGSVASIVISNPLDVIKTRIQNRDFNNPQSGVSILKNLVKNEGLTAFFKGVVPKTLVVGPKLIFSFTIAQTLITYIDARFYTPAAKPAASVAPVVAPAPVAVVPPVASSHAAPTAGPKA